MTQISPEMLEMGARARAAAQILATARPEAKTAALEHAADAILAQSADILAANARDMEAARAKGLSGAMLDRLALDEGRLNAVAGRIARGRRTARPGRRDHQRMGPAHGAAYRTGAHAFGRGGRDL